MVVFGAGDEECALGKQKWIWSGMGNDGQGMGKKKMTQTDMKQGHAVVQPKSFFPFVN